MADKGNGGTPPPPGAPRYVTTAEFKRYRIQNDEDHKYIHAALWGEKGTNGMVKDIHDLMMWIKFLGIIGAIVSPLVTSVIIKYLLG